MKMMKLFSLPIVAALMLVSYQISFADMGAQNIANQFNTLNGGKGVSFERSYSPSEDKVLQYNGTFFNTSAYASTTSGLSGTRQYFQTFCLEPYETVSTYNYGKLSYTGTTTQTYALRNGQTTAYNLAVGSAILYTQFATGTLANFNYTNTTARQTDSGLLRDAIRYLTGTSSTSNMLSNKYILQLVNSGYTLDFLKSTYNPNQFYSAIGDYSVFVMQVTGTSGNTCQDYLYLAKASDSSVPEPATVLLWGLGCASIYGANIIRKRRNPARFA